MLRNVRGCEKTLDLEIPLRRRWSTTGARIIKVQIFAFSILLGIAYENRSSHEIILGNIFTQQLPQRLDVFDRCPQGVDFARLVLQMGNVLPQSAKPIVDLLYSVSFSGVSPSKSVTLRQMQSTTIHYHILPWYGWGLRLFDAVMMLDEWNTL